MQGEENLPPSAHKCIVHCETHFHCFRHQLLLIYDTTYTLVHLFLLVFERFGDKVFSQETFHLASQVDFDSALRELLKNLHVHEI